MPYDRIGPASGVRDSVFSRESRPVGFAHRGFVPPGAANDENSMAAFERALALGYRHVETDARVTSDGVALAFHDDRLERVTDRRGCVSRLPWSVVRHARIAGREPIPRLEDVLAAWPDVVVNLDLKSDAAVAPALAALRRTGSTGRVCLAAFDDARLDRVRAELGPGVSTALGPSDVIRLRLAAWWGSPTSRALSGQCVQVPARVADRRFVTAAHARGLPVHVWTVNDSGAVGANLDDGVDGVITDRADILRDVMLRRGWWT